MIDSLYPADSFTLMQPYQVVADPNTTFAAPTDTISDQTGILATDVTAPVTVLPDTTEVTQPTDTETITPGTDEGVTPPVATEDSTTLGLTPGFGSIESTPLGSVGEPGSLDVQTGLAAGEQGGKGAGEDTGVLPESISMQTATDVQTPTDLASGNPDGVTPPDTDGLPPLGTTPSDNPTDVQLPADLSTSPLPPVETGVQVLEVAPPEGWRPSEDGSIDAFIDIDELCEAHPTDRRCHEDGSLGSNAETQQAAGTTTIGGGGKSTPGTVSPQEQEIRNRLADSIQSKHPEITPEELEHVINMVLVTASYYLNSSNPDELPVGVRVAALVTFEAHLNSTEKTGEDALKEAFTKASMAMYSAAASANDHSKETLAFLVGLVGFSSSSNTNSITPQSLPKHPYLLALAALSIFVIANQEGINFDVFNNTLLTELDDAIKTQPIVVTESNTTRPTGYADVYAWYRGRATPHFAIKVTLGKNSIATELNYVDETFTDAQIIPVSDQKLSTHHGVTRIPLPNAAAAMSFQESVLNTNVGLYDIRNNCCVTHVMDVLRAGGLPVSTKSFEQRKLLREWFQE